MKHYNRCLAMLLASVLFLLAGCHAVPDTTTGKRPSVPIIGDIDTTEPNKAPDGSYTYKLKYLPEKVDTPEGLPVLKWLCLEHDYMSERELSDDAAVAVNRLLAEKNMPFRIQFVLNFDGFDLMDWEEEADKYIKLVEEADLVYGNFLMDIAQQYLLPLTRYTEETGENSLAKAVPHDAYWHTAVFDGEVYGVPASVQYATSFSWFVDEKVMAEYGITADEFKKPYWELDDLFAKIYELNGNRPFLYDAVGNYWIETDPETGEKKPRGAYGVTATWPKDDFVPASYQYQLFNYFQLVGSCFAIDIRSGTPKVVNYLETDFTRQSQDAMLRYREAGYLTTNDAAALIQYTECYSDQVYLQEFEDGSYYYIPAQQAQFYTDQQHCRMNGISAKTQYPQEALMLLSLVANDEAFRELLLFGVQGQDYVMDDSGTPETILREDGTRYNMAFLSPYSELYGTRSTLLVPTQDGAARLQAHLETIDQALISYDIMFDFSPVEAELEAVNGFLNRKAPKDPDKDPPLNFSIFGNLTGAEYDQMLSDLKAAGSDKILAELQRQLDAWLAENPDWSK